MLSLTRTNRNGVLTEDNYSCITYWPGRGRVKGEVED